jgi:hypothetical protein
VLTYCESDSGARKSDRAQEAIFGAFPEALTGRNLALETFGEPWCWLTVVPFIGVIDMRRVILGTATLVLLAIALRGDAQPRTIDPKRSTVTVRVFKSGLFRAFADDHVIEAPLAEGSADDSATPDVRIAIDVRDMRVLDPGLSPTDRRDVQTRMLGPEVLDADRFPHIRFRSVAIQKGDADRWSILGELELHGQTRQARLNVVRDQGHYKGSTLLKQSEFGITPISIVGGTVKVKNEMKIDFDIVTMERP